MNRIQTPITQQQDGAWIEGVLREAVETAVSLQGDQPQQQPITISITYAPVTNIDNRQIVLQTARRVVSQCSPHRNRLTGGNMEVTLRRLLAGDDFSSDVPRGYTGEY